MTTSITNLFDQAHIPLQAAKWKQFTLRRDMYSDFSVKDKDYASFIDWHQSNKFQYQARKLTLALDAMIEFNQHQHQFLSFEQIEIRNILENIVNIEATKMQIAQLRKLEKIQGVSRDLEDSIATLKKDRAQLVKDIEDREIKFSVILKGKDLPKMQALFKHQESKFHFGKHIRRLNYVTDGMSMSKEGVDLHSKAMTSTPAGPAAGVAGFLSAIPIVALVSQAIPGVLNLVKNVAQKKTGSKILMNVGMLALMGGIVIASIAFPVAALGITIGMAAFKFMTSTILPLATMQINLRKLKQKIKALATRNKELENKDEFVVNEKLTNEEKHSLAKAVESYICSNPVDSEEMKNCMSLIMQGNDKDMLADNPIIKNVLGDKLLSQFIQDENKSRISMLEKNITKLETAQKKMSIQSALGTVALAGALIALIPTPLTWIMGGSLLLLTAVAGVAIKYDWAGKVKKFFGSLRDKLFGEKVEPVADPVEKEKPSNEVTLTADNAFISTQTTLLARLQSNPVQVNGKQKIDTGYEPESETDVSSSLPADPIPRMAIKEVDVVTLLESAEAKEEGSPKNRMK